MIQVKDTYLVMKKMQTVQKLKNDIAFSLIQFMQKTSASMLQFMHF